MVLLDKNGDTTCEGSRVTPSDRHFFVAAAHTHASRDSRYASPGDCSRFRVSEHNKNLITLSVIRSSQE